MPTPTAPSPTTEQAAFRDAIAVSAGSTFAQAGVAAVYLKAGSAADAAGAAVNIELVMADHADLRVRTQSTPAASQVLMGRVTVPGLQVGETLDAATGVGSLKGVQTLRRDDRFVVRGVDCNAPDKASVFLRVGRAYFDQGVWVGEVSAA